MSAHQCPDVPVRYGHAQSDVGKATQVEVDRLTRRVQELEEKLEQLQAQIEHLVGRLL